MSRVVVVLQRPRGGGGTSQVYLAEPESLDADTPQVLNGLDTVQLLQKLNTQPLAPDAVKEVGTQLLDLLATHAAIKATVLPHLDLKDNSERPIYLVVKDPELEKLPWEAIHAPNAGFVCGEKRWPFARANSLASSQLEHPFLPPLKLMVILGASGTDKLTRIPANEEWRSIYQAVKKSQLNIRMRVLVCDEDDLKREIDAEGNDWIETKLLIDQEALFNDIKEFSPHILHFFCHGLSTPTPHLQIASCVDWESKQDGSIHIEGLQLRDRPNLKDSTWLVILNCCESAQQGSSPGSRSLPLASALVTAGFPAVVGMRERVEISLANVFCRLFYDAMLTDLEERLEAAAKDGKKEVHWACSLYAARQRICEELAKQTGGLKTFTAVASGVKEWTIPVVYARLQTFNLLLLPDRDGTHPVHRSKSVGSGPATPAGPVAGALTLENLRRLADEREALLADREKFKHLTKLVQKIDERLKEIDKELS